MNETGYAGDVSCGEAWQALSDDPNAVLVDIRTGAEWQLIGQPDLSEIGKQALSIQWQVFPDLTINENFAADLAAAGVGPDQRIYFLCRSGPRSINAATAMTASGYKHCYNVVNGFEGPLDENRQRGRRLGWKAEGLPWGQS